MSNHRRVDVFEFWLAIAALVAAVVWQLMAR
jgi:hypothetical protein